MKMFCANCNTQLTEGANFCTMCGTKIMKTNCPECNAQLMESANFCAMCGTRIIETPMPDFHHFLELKNKDPDRKDVVSIKCEINYWEHIDSDTDLSEKEKESFRCTEDFSHPVSREALKRQHVYVCSTCAAAYTFEGEKCCSCKKVFDNAFVSVWERQIYIQLKGEKNYKLGIMEQDGNIPNSKIVDYDTGEELDTKDIESYYFRDAYCENCIEKMVFGEYWGDEDWADYYGMDVEDYKRDGGESHGY